MGRLIDADSAYTVLTDYYHHKTDAQHMALKDALDKVETVEAIPVDWLMQKADWCDKNNGIFVSGAIRSAVDAWREEQNNGQID